MNGLESAFGMGACRLGSAWIHSRTQARGQLREAVNRDFPTSGVKITSHLCHLQELNLHIFLLVNFGKGEGCNRRGSMAEGKTNLLAYQKGVGHTSKTCSGFQRVRESHKVVLAWCLSKANANKN